MKNLTSPVSESDHALGDIHAPLVLVQYGDLECPDCGKAAEVINAVRTVIGPDLCVVFRHFPLTQVHAQSLRAAEACEAAAAQGKFWEMHDLILEVQDRLNPEIYPRLAEVLQLDYKSFSESLSAHEYAAKVRQDFLSGLKSGVNTLPALFLNGVKLEIPVTVPHLVSAIRAAELEFTRPADEYLAAGEYKWQLGHFVPAY